MAHSVVTSHPSLLGFLVIVQWACEQSDQHGRIKVRYEFSMHTHSSTKTKLNYDHCSVSGMLTTNTSTQFLIRHHPLKCSARYRRRVYHNGLLSSLEQTFGMHTVYFPNPAPMDLKKMPSLTSWKSTEHCSSSMRPYS